MKFNFSTYCLHTASDGKVWKAETGRENMEFLSARNRLEPGTYRIIGVPKNYKLIIETYQQLKDMADTYLLVGSPYICSQYNCNDDNAEEVLTCVRSLSVCDSLVNCWHRVNPFSCKTFTLLYFLACEGLGAKSQIVYDHYQLKPYFDFAGFDQEQLIFDFLNEIVDPRWYLNLQKPQRLSKLESYFGLKDKQYAELISDCELVPRSPFITKRLLMFSRLVDSLSEDSPLRQEQAKHTEAKELTPFESRLLLLKLCFGFIVRHWLQELGSVIAFSAPKFFTAKSALFAYQERFDNAR